MDFMFDWENENDRFSFEDSERFEEDSLCSWISEPESLCNNWRGWKRQNGGGQAATNNKLQGKFAGNVGLIDTFLHLIFTREKVSVGKETKKVKALPFVRPCMSKRQIACRVNTRGRGEPPSLL
jgi:hypothetical protein